MGEAETDLRSAWDFAAAVHDAHTGRRRWDGGPALVDKRRPARREQRHPDRVDRVASELDDSADTGDGEELVVDDVQEISRRKTIRWRDDVCLAPADELLANVDRQWAMTERRAQPPDRNRRPQRITIGEINTPACVHLIVRISPEIDAGSKLNPPRRLDEQLVSHEKIAEQPRRIVRRRLRKKPRRLRRNRARRQPAQAAREAVAHAATRTISHAPH